MSDKLQSSKDMTVRKFMLKKFPTSKYIDCPIPKHHWETIQEYANAYAESYHSDKMEELRKDLPEIAYYVYTGEDGCYESRKDIDGSWIDREALTQLIERGEG